MQDLTRKLHAFQSQLPERMAGAGVPGLAIAALEDGVVTWTAGFGTMRRDAQQPVRGDTIFQAASLSKPVFAYAALRLCDIGRLDLDRPLNDYLPLPEASEAAGLERISARQVLSHSTGLQNWRFGPEDDLRLAFPSGTQFAYSGEGYVYLQRVVEQVAGRPFESFMQAELLGPLGMRHSTYLWQLEHEPLVAAGHCDDDEPAEPYNAWQGRRLHELAQEWQRSLDTWRYDDIAAAAPALYPDLAALPNNLIPNAAGSLMTTVADYAQFMTLVLAPRGDRLELMPDTRRAMLSPQIRIDDELAWGLGWGLAAGAAHATSWHWGDNGRAQHFVVADPARRAGLVLLTNDCAGLALCEQIYAAVAGHGHPAFGWLKRVF